jgi:hypothetical protein
VPLPRICPPVTHSPSPRGHPLAELGAVGDFEGSFLKVRPDGGDVFFAVPVLAALQGDESAFVVDFL